MPTQYYDPNTGKPVSAPASSSVQYYNPDTGEAIKETANSNATEPTFGKQLLGDLKNFGSDALQGLGESVIGGLTGTDEWARKHLPAFWTNSNMGFGKPADLNKLKSLATPDSDNNTQKLFKGVGDVSQFFVPGEAEDVAATKAASLLPKTKYALSPITKTIEAVPNYKAAVPAIKAGISALSSGLVNKNQGGDFTTGALVGGATRGIAEGASSLAPTISKMGSTFTKSHPILGELASPFGLGAYGAYKGFHTGDTFPERVENAVKGGLEGAGAGILPKVAAKALENPQVISPILYGLINQLTGR